MTDKSDLEHLIHIYQRHLQLLAAVQGWMGIAEHASQEQVNTRILRQILVAHFNDSELRDLCFDLKVDYESLPGQGKSDKARELVGYMQRHGRIYELVMLGGQCRPDINWDHVNLPNSLDGLTEYIKANIDQLQRKLGQLPLESAIQFGDFSNTTGPVGSTTTHLPSIELPAGSVHGALAEDVPYTLTVIDPAIELHAYYIASAAGDSSEQQGARRNIFTAQLQQAADALRGWLGLPVVPIVWQPDRPAGPSTMVRRYYSDLWRDAAESYHVWLIAYELNDTYLLRCVIERPGRDYPPHAFDDLQHRLPWQPDSGTPEWLGQRLVYYTSPYTGSPTALARAVFNTPMVLQTTLASGELYCCPDLASAYLLVGVRPEQEALAGDFLDRLAPQLGWHICRAIGQERQYLTYLAPTVNAAEQLLSSMLRRARQLHKQAWTGPSDSDDRVALAEQIYTIEAVFLEYRALLALVEQVLEVIRRNVDNYRWVSAPGAWRAEAALDEIFVAQRRELDVLPARIHAAFHDWEIMLKLAQDHLNILRRTG
jgi:hypothetical protein